MVGATFGGVLIGLTTDVAVESEGLRGWSPLLLFLGRRVGLFFLLLTIVDNFLRERNKIKQLCCGTVNPIIASSWKVFRRALKAFDQLSIEMLVLR